MTTISDAFDLPLAEDIRAMGFVVKLRESDPTGPEVQKLVQDYVVTPAVAAELPRILDDMRQVFNRGEEYGRFIHGSFGSGKSHFMTMLSLLIEGAEAAWSKPDPTFVSLRPKHRDWLSGANLLVVRLHMLSVRGKDTSLDRAVYEAFNAALKRRGKAAFEFLNVDGLLDEIRREAAEYGDLVWARLSQANILGSRAEFESIVAGGPKGRERLARAWLTFKGRDVAQAGIDPRWTEGIRRMGAHAKAQGFGGIVLMIDEFLLWLAEKSGQEFVREINDLNVIVDHTTGQRPAPVFVFVARQRNLQEFFPDLVDESKIHEHIDHHAKRFELTRLQDVELRHIVKGRVLRPKLPDAVAAAVAELGARHDKILPALLAGADHAYLTDVYPFHPALIEMLVDVTSLMQRERSALRLLYELLVVHYPHLPLGEFLPVGSAFDAIFPASGVEASKKVELLQDVHHQYYNRLALAMRQMVDDTTTDFDEGRRRALDQLIKTVLLAEVSPRLKGAGLTVERLVQLNSVDVDGETFRGRARVAETDLLALSQLVPDLVVAGTGRSAVVRYVLGKVSLGEILQRAKSKAGNQHFNVFWPALKKALGIVGNKGFEGNGNSGDLDLMWRKTLRRGSLKLGNVREMPYDDFEPPPKTFRVLVDYPWDEAGHSVDEDRLRALGVRKTRGNKYTVCWLPRHMAPNELGVLTEIAAVRFLLSEPGQEELLESLGPTDRARVLEQAAERERTFSSRLDELIKELYIAHGELVALISDIDKARPHPTLRENLDHITTLLMDRQFPQHPPFGAEPKKADLELLLKWMVVAGESNVSVPYDDPTGRVLKTLGQPLELVNLGQTKATLRLDTRIIKEVLQRVDQPMTSWEPIADHLRETYGLPQLVIDLFLCFLCQRDHRALHEITGESITVSIGGSPSVKVKLQRGTLVDAPDWHRLRDLGNHLFAAARPPAHRSLQAQDRFASELRGAARARRLALQGLHQRLVQLGAEGGERCEEVAQANARLAPLGHSTTDSHKTLAELLALWPADDGDPIRSVVQQAEAALEALARLDDGCWRNLSDGRDHPELGAEVDAHLSGLHTRLRSPQAQAPVTTAWVDDWNRRAQDLIGRLIRKPTPPPAPTPTPPPATPPPGPPPPTPPPAKKGKVLHTVALDPGDADAISDFLADVRRHVSELGAGKVRLALVREEDEL